MKNCERDSHTWFKKTKPSEETEVLHCIFFFPKANTYRLTTNVCVKRLHVREKKRNINAEKETVETEWALTNCDDRLKLRSEMGKKWVGEHFKTSGQLMIFQGTFGTN